MITVNDIAVEFGGTTLFSEVTFAINETDKIALMGKNGAGKSTLLKIVAGQNKPTRGSISAPKEAVIAYLPQHLLIADDCTVMEETSKAFAEVFKMKAEIDHINEQLTIRTDYESDDYMKLIERVSELSEKYYSIEEVNYEAEVEKVLKGLGFEREDFTRSTSEFSGGWRMRVAPSNFACSSRRTSNAMKLNGLRWPAISTTTSCSRWRCWPRTPSTRPVKRPTPRSSATRDR